MGFALNCKNHIILTTIAICCMILATVFFIGCDGGGGDGLGNPQSTVIGSQGGVALSADGNVSVEIPAGALSSDTQIKVEEASVSPSNTIGKAYKFAPEDFQFSKPVKISLKYDADDIPEGVFDHDLLLGRESGGNWNEIPGCTTDAVNHVVSGSVTGFSKYGIFWTSVPSTSAETWNLVNNQICKVLDAIRAFNRGQLMVIRGLENDFAHEFDPLETEYSDWQLDCVLAGYTQTAEALEVLEDALLELANLEEAAHGLITPSGIVAWDIGDVADTLNGIAWNLLKKFIPFKDTWDNSNEKIRQKMREYVSEVVANRNQTPTDCELLCCINKLFDSVLGDPFSDNMNNDICSENETELREAAFRIINKLSSKELRMLSGSFSRCAKYDVDMRWYRIFKDNLNDTASEAYKEGLKTYWDAYKKVVPVGKAGTVIENMSVSYGNPDLGQKAVTGVNGVITPAHVVIFLVPDDMENLPIVVMAAVPDDDGMIEIPEPCVGSHRVFCYSKGNYPVILDNVDISTASQRIDIPVPTPLEDVANPLFPASTADDPLKDIDPPFMSGCAGCEGSYRVVHEVNISGTSWGNVGTTSYEYSTRAEFTFDWDENWVASVDVPYVIHLSYSPWVSVSGTITTTKSPSIFNLKGIARWKIFKRMRDNQPRYYAYVSTMDEESQVYTVTNCVPEGCFLVSTQEMRTWNYTGNFFPTDLGTGDMPIFYEEHTVELYEDSASRKQSDITVTIEEIVNN